MTTAYYAGRRAYRPVVKLAALVASGKRLLQGRF